MKKLQCVILGYGERSSNYSVYALNHPDKMEVIAVIDPSPLKLDKAEKVFGLSKEMLFSNLSDFLEKKIPCDFVINGTMDSLHYSTSVMLLKNKYNILLEKPVTAVKEELLDLQRLARENGCKVLVCHVLRYTPFYREIKKTLLSGVIGKITGMQLNEHVWHGHFINAYVRGKWRSEKECGSGLLLAKCCHDTDLLCWLNNDTEPEYVSSFGSRSLYCEENAPEGATEYCYTCPHKERCVFNAYDFEYKRDFIPFYTWAGINKPLEEITDEEKLEFLKHDAYGKCIYKTDMDIVDRQCVSVSFKNGSIATLNMIGGTTTAGRHIHITGEMGEIVGYIEQNKFTVRRLFEEEKVIDLDKINKLEGDDNSVTGHYGGDYYIMQDMYKLLSGGEVSVSCTDINDSVNGHLLVYAAEKARKENRVVGFAELAAEKR